MLHLAMLRLSAILSFLLVLSLTGQAWAQDVDLDWGPVDLHGRIGVVHDGEMSLVRLGLMAGYLAGDGQGSGGLFWVVGPAANFCLTGADLEDGTRDYYQGWSAGPEGRIGWAWGEGYRKASIHLGLQPYFMQMFADSGRDFTAFGLRASVGFAYGHRLLGRRPEVFFLPNHIELVADVMRAGPFDELMHWGLSVGWGY